MNGCPSKSNHLVLLSEVMGSPRSISTKVHLELLGAPRELIVAGPRGVSVSLTILTKTPVDCSFANGSHEIYLGRLILRWFGLNELCSDESSKLSLTSSKTLTLANCL